MWLKLRRKEEPTTIIKTINHKRAQVCDFIMVEVLRTKTIHFINRLKQYTPNEYK